VLSALLCGMLAVCCVPPEVPDVQLVHADISPVVQARHGVVPPARGLQRWTHQVNNQTALTIGWGDTAPGRGGTGDRETGGVHMTRGQCSSCEPVARSDKQGPSSPHDYAKSRKDTPDRAGGRGALMVWLRRAPVVHFEYGSVASTTSILLVQGQKTVTRYL
jgi:hypothetical protein